MKKQDLIEYLTHNCGLQRASAIRAVEGVFNKITESLSNGDSVYLRGFGTFKVCEVKEKIGRNINTGATVPIPAHKTVKLILGNQLKELMK